jgi:uncharacterized protein (DUF849 family)
MAGHVRVGLEGHLNLPDGSPASNPLLVEKIVRLARESATADEARTLLALDPSRKNRILNMLG